MSLSRGELGWLLGQLVDEDAATRMNAAGVVTDWENALSPFDTRIIVRCLSLLAANEGPGDVREAQLHAADLIFDPIRSTKDDVQPILEISADSLDRQDKEYVDDIGEMLDEFERGLWKS